MSNPYFRPFARPARLRHAAVAAALAAGCAGAWAQPGSAPAPSAQQASALAQPAPAAPSLNSICANGATWEEADTVTVHFPNENVTLSMNRFDDALRVKIVIGQEEREMIRLDNGLTAVRAANDLGPRQFAGVDLLANSALHYLQQGFKTPCAASKAHHFSLDLQDGPKSDPGTVHMEGDMEQTGEALGYGLIVTEREGRANATILKTSGSWDFADLGDIPDDTPIAGWRVYRDGDPVLLERRELQVVEDLRRLTTRD